MAESSKDSVPTVKLKSLNCPLPLAPRPANSAMGQYHLAPNGTVVNSKGGPDGYLTSRQSNNKKEESKLGGGPSSRNLVNNNNLFYSHDPRKKRSSYDTPNSPNKLQRKVESIEERRKLIIISRTSEDSKPAIEPLYKRFK